MTTAFSKRRSRNGGAARGRPAEVGRVLKRVQRFDPTGVRERDLRECLLAQLQNLGMEES